MKSGRVVYRRIAARMALMDLKKIELARLLGVSYSTLQNKLCGVTEFTLGEVLEIKRILCLNCPVEEAFERFGEA